MKYDLEWDPAAENELTNIWVPADSDLRLAVTQAAHVIDRLLTKDPLSQSESRPDGRRILFERPLAVTYEVIEESRLVRVLHVWRIKRKSEK